MKHGGRILLLLVQAFLLYPVLGQEGEGGFKKKVFYSALAGYDEAAVEKQLLLVKQAGIPEKEAYEGALLMKKAGLVKGAKKKLDLFKAGHRKLDIALNRDSTNIEFRLLRLIIQENAPPALGYKNDLDKDLLYIKSNYKKSSPALQQVILDYSKSSKKLKNL